jgi:membrane fusion protein (multidrug efflux system)
MKKIILSSFVILFLASCGSKTNKGDVATKRAQLDDLKKQQTLLREKIATLESQLAILDTSMKKDEKLKFVGVTEVAPGDFNHFVEVEGKVVGDQDVMVSSELPGTVTSVLVNPGDHVATGQVLATLDDASMKENLASMKAQRDMANTMYDRQKNLWDQKIGSEVQFIQARTQKEAMDRQYGALREQWNAMRIKSPINGTVDLVNIKIGQTIAPGMPVARVVNLSNLKVKGEVAESYITKVKKGNDVILYFPDVKKEVKAKLNYSGQVVNELNRTFNVEVKLDSKEGDFRPNQVVVIKIADYSASNSIVVPVGVVQKSGDGAFVYVADNMNGKVVAKRKIVTTGMNYNGNIEILDGLASGDKVITEGYQNLVEGDAIKL